MDYEKKYKEALERARICHKDMSNLDGVTANMAKDFFEEVFPELCESEDERIRGALICGMYALKEQHKTCFASIPIDNAIAWLEKQDEPTDINPSEFDLRLNKLLKQFETLPKEELASSLSFYLNVVQNDGTYKADENQGDKNPCETCEEPRLNCQNFPCEKKKNFDSVNKVEPKFHEGDWIITPNNATKQIERVTFGNYYFTDKTLYNIIDTDNKGHLWTIQDAKDGDVLAESKGDVILMFRGIGNARWDDVIDYHFYYDCYRENFIVQEDVNYWGNTENNQLKPATKEQRDLLFQKMKEASYEWDFEKKELKKIEQNLAWSEEDEEMFEKILQQFMTANNDCKLNNASFTYDKEISFLKSLKERYTWKPIYKD